MNRHRRVTSRVATALLCFVLSGIRIAGAQTDSLSRLGSDELFARARELAFHKHHEEARSLLRLVLQKSPGYTDARILLARTYAWDGKRDSARVELHRVLSDRPTSHEALNALIDVELWDDKYETALRFANEALKPYPSDEDFLIRKVRALKNLGRNEEALATLNTLEDIHPSAAGVASLREEIKSRYQDNSLGVNYSTDRFSEIFDPMHYAYIQYGRRTLYGTGFARFNYSRRFGAEGTQLEGDFYPRIAEGMYAYLNYGYSASSLYPKHRFGGELYRSLPYSTEASIGLRYLWFGPGSTVTIYTGSIGYYHGSYWLSVRPYLTPGGAGTSQSLSGTVRRYFGDAENYISIRAGAGFTPDERTLQSSSGFAGKEIFHLKSQTAGIGIQYSLSESYLLISTLDYTNQELSFSPGEYVKMYSFAIGVRVKF